MLDMSNRENDLKRIRKLRKALRQVEHLLLLPRELNDDEKQKISKRSSLRQDLIDLCSIYKDEVLDTSDDITINSVDGIPNPNASFIDNSVDYQPEIDFQDQNIDIVDEKLKTSVFIDDNRSDDIKQQSKIELNKDSEILDAKTTTTLQADEKKADNIKKKKRVDAVSTTFKTKRLDDAHDDLINCMDICTDSELVVTGSRDTSVKVWNYQTGTMLYSLGGHTAAITCVRFWPMSFYKASYEYLLANLNTEDQLYDDAQDALDKLNETTTDYPMIISSSLDCTFRVWSISSCSYTCLKQYYLYNRITSFSISANKIAFALDGGKIEYWKNTVKQINMKAFDDFECVNAIEIIDDKIYALANTGSFKIFSIEESNGDVLKLLVENDKSMLPSTNIRQYYKSFTRLNDEQILLLNNQSYIVLQNLKQNECELISVANNAHDLTTCIFKLDDLLYVASYNIDKGSPIIHVFSMKENLKYQHTIEEDTESSSSVSVLCSKPLGSDASILVSASNGNITVWTISNDKKYNNRVYRTKMYNYDESMNMSGRNNDESDSDNSDAASEDSVIDDNTENDDEKDSKPARYCSIQ